MREGKARSFGFENIKFMQTDAESCVCRKPAHAMILSKGGKESQPVDGFLAARREIFDFVVHAQFYLWRTNTKSQ